MHNMCESFWFKLVPKNVALWIHAFGAILDTFAIWVRSLACPENAGGGCIIGEARANSSVKLNNQPKWAYNGPGQGQKGTNSRGLMAASY